jgi:hypothetical protein
MPEVTPAFPVRLGRAEQMFPTLTTAQIARVAQHGRRRHIRAGETLIEVGQTVVPLCGD